MDPNRSFMREQKDCPAEESGFVVALVARYATCVSVYMCICIYVSVKSMFVSVYLISTHTNPSKPSTLPTHPLLQIQGRGQDGAVDNAHRHA